MPLTAQAPPLQAITALVAAGYPTTSATPTNAERLARGSIFAQLDALVQQVLTKYPTIDQGTYPDDLAAAKESLNDPSAYSFIDTDTGRLFNSATAIVNAAVADSASHAIPIHIFPLPSPVGSSGSTTTSSSSTPSNTGTIIAVVAGVVGISAIALLAYKMKQQPPKRISKRH